MQMASAQKKQSGRQTPTTGRFSLRQNASGTWDVFEIGSDTAVQLSGIPLSGLAHDEAQGALHLLKARAITPDDRT